MAKKVTNPQMRAIKNILADALGQAAPGRDGARRLIERKKELKARFLEVLREVGVDDGDNVSHREARKLMGSNFLDASVAERFFGELTDEQRKEAKVIPSKILAAIRRMSSKERVEHTLMFDTGISILDIREKAPEWVDKPDDDWYRNEEFAKRTETARWRLIRNRAVSGSYCDGSYARSFKQQVERLGKDQEVPSTRQVIYLTVLTMLARKKRAFPNYPVRTSDMITVTQTPYHVHVGWHAHVNGLVIGGLHYDKGDAAGLCLASAFKT